MKETDKERLLTHLREEHNDSRGGIEHMSAGKLACRHRNKHSARLVQQPGHSHPGTNGMSIARLGEE